MMRKCGHPLHILTQFSTKLGKGDDRGSAVILFISVGTPQELLDNNLLLTLVGFMTLYCTAALVSHQY